MKTGYGYKLFEMDCVFGIGYQLLDIGYCVFGIVLWYLLKEAWYKSS